MVGFLRFLWEAELFIVEGAFMVVVLFRGGASIVLLDDLTIEVFVLD